MNETTLKKKLFRILSNYTNIYVRKLSDRFHAGILDVFICFEGRAIWCELKVLPNKSTLLQLKEIEAIHKAGGDAVVISMNKTGDRFYLGAREFLTLEMLIAELLGTLYV